MKTLVKTYFFAVLCQRSWMEKVDLAPVLAAGLERGMEEANQGVAS